MYRAPVPAVESLFEIWESDRPAVGVSSKIPSPLVAEALVGPGVDFVYVDQQHGLFDRSTLLVMFQAIAGAGALPLTRVAANAPELIMGALDLGAHGVIVPDVETRDAAERAVAACQYPPEGTRSYGLLRTNFAARSAEEIERAAPACIAMIESVTGVANLSEIARVDGLAAILIGPQDLAMSLGLRPNPEWLSSARVVSAINEIKAGCDEAAIPVGIGVGRGELAPRWLAEGFRFISIGSDVGYLHDSVMQAFVDARRPIERQ